jgi:hypothetical protein
MGDHARPMTQGVPMNTDFVLTRELIFTINGVEKRSTVSIGPIIKVDETLYKCKLDVPFLDIPGRNYGPGIDAISALTEAIRIIRTIIIHSVDDGFAQVRWLDEGDYGGFGRDLFEIAD